MPNGFWYAGGDTHVVESAIPASAFSKGDLLTFTSTSSLSRINELMASGSDIAGVALSDSNDSIANQVPYLVPGPDTLFWASLATNISNVTPGFECDIAFGTGNGRYYVAPGSASSVRVAVVRGAEGVGSVSQSVQSKALVRLIYHAGNLEL